MFEQIIHALLGPSGVKILDWYIANSLYVNGLVVLVGLFFVLAPRQSRKMIDRIRVAWSKTPFALDEKDRQAFEKARAHYVQKKKNRKR